MAGTVFKALPGNAEGLAAFIIFIISNFRIAFVPLLGGLVREGQQPTPSVRLIPATRPADAIPKAGATPGRIQGSSKTGQ